MDSYFDELYADLHRLARIELHRLGGASLSASTLLHEAYLDMASRGVCTFPDRARFLCYASRAMRGLIVDHARSRQAQKRGGLFELTTLPNEIAADDHELSQISDALDALAKSDPDLAQLVDLKFFCGFSFVEIAAMQDLTERTIQRRWEKARLYLYSSIRAEL